MKKIFLALLGIMGAVQFAVYGSIKDVHAHVACLQQNTLGSGSTIEEQVAKIDGVTCGYHALKNACVMLDAYYAPQRDGEVFDPQACQKMTQDKDLFLDFMQGALPYVLRRRAKYKHPNQSGGWLEEQEIAYDGTDSLLAAVQGNVSEDMCEWQEHVSEHINVLFPNLPAKLEDHITVISQIDTFDIVKPVSTSTTLHESLGCILQKLHSATHTDQLGVPEKYMHCFLVNTASDRATLDVRLGCHYVAYVVFVNAFGKVEAVVLNSFVGCSNSAVFNRLYNIFVGPSYTSEGFLPHISRVQAYVELQPCLQILTPLQISLESKDAKRVKELLQNPKLKDLFASHIDIFENLRMEVITLLCNACRDTSLRCLHDDIYPILGHLCWMYVTCDLIWGFRSCI